MRLVFIYTVPTGAEPRLCVRRPESDHHCDILYAVAQRQDGNYRDHFTPARLTALQLTHFDPWDYLCQSDYCRVMDNGKILYLDEDHLSAWGGEFIALKADDDLSSVLRPAK